MQKNMGPLQSPYLKNSNVIRHYFRKKKLTSSLRPEEKETTRSYSWTPLPQSSIAKSTPCRKRSGKQRTNSWMKTWQKAISYHRTLPTASPLSWSQRKTQRRCGTSLTTALSMQLPEKTSHHCQTLDSALKIYKGWRSSANLTFDGAITTSTSTQETSGTELSKCEEDYSYQ